MYSSDVYSVTVHRLFVPLAFLFCFSFLGVNYRKLRFLNGVQYIWNIVLAIKLKAYQSVFFMQIIVLVLTGEYDMRVKYAN